MALALPLALLALMAKKPVSPSPSPSPTPLPSSFEKWKQEFGKSYSTEAEETMASAHFARAAELIDAHNTQPLAFRLAHNQFSDMSPSQVRARFCTRSRCARRAR